MESAVPIDAALSTGVEGPKEVFYHPSFEKDEKWLQWISEEFLKISGAEGIIGLRDFKNALGLKSSKFAERMFTMFDTDRTGFLTLEQFLRGIIILSHGTRKEKVLFIFKAWDFNGNGFLDCEELRQIITACSEECNIFIGREILESLLDELFAVLDTNKDALISLDELVVALNRQPKIFRFLKLHLQDIFKDIRKKEQLLWEARKYRSWYEDCLKHATGSFTVIAYLVLCAIMFAIYALMYVDQGTLAVFGRGTGILIDLNMALVIVTSLRHMWTENMNTLFAQLTPPRLNIYVHQTAAYIICFLMLIHGITNSTHLYFIVHDEFIANQLITNVTTTTASSSSKSSGSELVSLFLNNLLGRSANTGWLVRGTTYPSGIALIFVFLLLFVVAHDFIRLAGYFNLHRIVHKVYVLLWILLFIHDPHFYIFMTIPWLMLTFDFLWPYISGKFWNMTTKEVETLAHRVALIVIERPSGFKFQPGDYIFLKVPTISKFEWHPFYITSSPCITNEIWIHVRAAGKWTDSLVKICKGIQMGKKTTRARVSAVGPDVLARTTVYNNYRRKIVQKPWCTLIQVDGPYHSNTADILRTEHVVLISYGTGVFAYLSLIETICDYLRGLTVVKEWTKINIKLKRIDLIWIARDHRSVEWCLNVFRRVERLDPYPEGLFNIQVYLTSANAMKDYRGFSVQVALYTMYLREKRDMITGLKSMINPGQPHWDQILQEVKNNRLGEMKVFFSGQSRLGLPIKENCKALQLQFKQFT